MKIVSEETGESVIITIFGNMDTLNSNQLEMTVEKIVTDSLHCKAVFFNLENVDFISSSGLRVIIKMLKICEPAGIKIGIFSLKPPVRKAFEMIKLDDLFEIYNDRDDALRNHH